MRMFCKSFLILSALCLVLVSANPLAAAPYLVLFPENSRLGAQNITEASSTALKDELGRWNISIQQKGNLPHIHGTRIDLDPDDLEAFRTIFPEALVVPGDLKLKASYTSHTSTLDEKPLSAQGTAWHTKLAQELLETARNQRAAFQNVYIAVLDSGISNHPDFDDRIRYDLARNTLDSGDGDGANPDKLFDVTDLHGHGTAVTGVIAGNVTGVCPEVNIIPVRIANGEAMADFSDMAEGIDYLIGLVDNGILPGNSHLIVNMSYNTLTPLSNSDPDAEKVFRDMIRSAASRNILFVASAGNNGMDIDESFVYPTSLYNGNFISVAATTARDMLTSFSNYGLHTVEVAAPGQNILTTTLEGSTGIWSGTSFAAPFTSGIAALLWTLHEELTDIQIRNVLINATDIQRFLSTTAGLSSSITVMAGDCMTPSELTDDSFIASAAGSSPITGNETVDFVPDDAGTGDTGGVAGGGGGCNLATPSLQAMFLLPLLLLSISRKHP